MIADELLRFIDLPGADLVQDGLADLRAGRETIAGSLVSLAAPRLRGLGVDVPEMDEAEPGHRLYALLVEERGGAAYGRYRALLARISSFARMADHARPG